MILNVAQTKAKAEAEARVNAGCGDGTVLVNGVCEAPKTSGMSIDPLYIVIAVVAIGGVIGGIFAVKKGSNAPKPVQQESPSRRQTTVLFCGKCGSSLKPGVKFCGKCGNPRS